MSDPDSPLTALLAQLRDLSKGTWCEHYTPEMYAPTVPGRAGADGRPICVKCERSLTAHVLHLAADELEALAACPQEAEERCGTCGHPLSTHDSGPSEDGCRFMFRWGAECECGFPTQGAARLPEEARPPAQDYTSSSTHPEFDLWWDRFGAGLVEKLTPYYLAFAAWAAGEARETERHESRSPDGDGQEMTNPASGTLRGLGRRVLADTPTSRTGATSPSDRTERTGSLGTNDDQLRRPDANEADGSNPSDSLQTQMPEEARPSQGET